VECVWVKWEEVTEDWRKWHNEEHDVYCSSNIIVVNISRRIWLARHVACIWERCIQGLVEKLRE
jgi:hypothetical protein